MKKLAMCLALMLATTVFAEHAKTLNKTGLAGVGSTQSAQSLGHSKLVFVLLNDMGFGRYDEKIDDTTSREIPQYEGFNTHAGFAIGLSDYFDIGLTLPAHYKQWKPSAGADLEKDYDYWTAKAEIKLRMPLPEDQPFDMALFGSAEGSSMESLLLNGGLALTLDFDKSNDVPFIVHVNGGLDYALNQPKGTVRYTDLESVTTWIANGSPFIEGASVKELEYGEKFKWFASGAVEVFPFEFLSIFLEYRWGTDYNFTPHVDRTTQDPSNPQFGKERKDWYFETVDESNTSTMVYKNRAALAFVFHLPAGFDLHVGASASWDGSIGDFAWPKSFQHPIYAGLTWSRYLIAQDSDGDGFNDDEDDCPYDYGHRLNRGCPLGNPDVDEDGVCDAWVSEKGMEDEFSEVCEGIDECPNQAGEASNGCPLDDPDPDGDGVCDPWVSQKKMLKKFKKVCKGIDECPSQPGDPNFNGCPGKKADPDGDGMCSPWVTDEGLLGKFSDECTGYDMCPGEAGTKANKGCPWDDPDVDGDGLCDPWVTEKKMGYYFEKAGEDETIANEWFIDKSCKGIDKCPTEHGPASNEGCPLDKPDPDGDGVCSPWVSEKGMSEQFEDICVGIDKCPNEAGEQFANGCPMDNPDIDGDSLCAPWVTEKKMQKQFAEICHGVDKCETEAGPEWNKGCPVDDPDPDKDGLCSQWVTKQNLLSKFADVCKGKDQCEDEAGPDWNKGCPSDDQPDPDGDGLCSPWVSKKGLNAKFKDVCKGFDKCEDEAGPDWNKGCPAQSPDPDEDGLCSPWVTKQKLLDKFSEECSGYDRCEDEPGPDWNNGCPSDDDPDADHDGVCSEWVTTKKLTAHFADQCTGIDRCPDVAGDDGHGCPKKPVEKLDGVTFKSGKATLESNAKLILKNVAKKLNTDEYMDLNIVIQGHTDNVGKEASNQKLSENRAKEVMKALTKAGIKKNRIKAIGMGSTCPVDDNGTEEGREMNRRIEMHFATPDNDGTKCESNFVSE
ncbi:MAG: OmpA family protein [Fibrobacter sp.]|nr:OmpA family protein [Fibrobacter sp.]